MGPGLCRSAPDTLSRQVADAGERLSRPYASIEAGTIDGIDATLEERVAALKPARDSASDALEYAKRSSALPIEIDPVAINRFSRLMREQLVSGDAAASKAYLSAVVDAIAVSDNTIRIMGSNENIRSTRGRMANPSPRFVSPFRLVRHGDEVEKYCFVAAL